MKKVLVYLAVPVLYILHQDWWNWDSQQLVLGLPMGLAYHVGFCVAASCLMYCLVRCAWPSHLEVEAADARRENADPWQH
jgi:Protein of unknown function (DUF3311)